MKISGIYRIVCTKNGRYYIGSSSNINKRWATHKKQLSDNVHPNVFMQRAWNKYGETSFRIEILEHVSNDMLLSVEQNYLSEHVGSQNCMNLKLTAGGGVSKRDIDKFRYARVGKAPWNKGLTKETDSRVKQYAEACSITKKGKSITPWNKGKTGVYSDEILNKMKKAHSGKTNPSRAKVTAEIVTEIRNLFSLGNSKVFIGKKYGISPETVAQIVNQKTWKHVQ